MRYSLLFLLTLALLACKKKDQLLGKELLGPDVLLNGVTTDTFYLATSVILEDSMITDNAANVVLGSYNDPKFGTFTSSFYTQLRLAGVNPNFGDPSAIVVDSFILGLEYAGLNFTIIGDDSVQAQLRIPLDTNLAKQFIAEATNGSSTFASNTNFQSYFKGLLVQTNNGSQSVGQGGVFYFNLNDPGTKLTIYYRQGGVEKTYDFLMNSTCADFSHVNINRNGSAVEQVINNPSQGLQEFYAQAFGVRAKVVIPGLNQFTENQLIHRAEIHLPIQFQLGSKYKPGSTVSFATKKTAVSQGYINTGVLGVYSESKKEFSADLKSYVQAVINKDIENTGLIVSPRFFVNSAERIIFNGPNTINKMRPKIIITYTDF